MGSFIVGIIIGNEVIVLVVYFDYVLVLVIFYISESIFVFVVIFLLDVSIS